jgi:hypothetical protein
MTLDTAQETARRKEKFKQYLHSPEYQAKLINRLKINDAADKKIEARALAYQMCAQPENPAEGCIFFIENFGWTFDPRPQADPFNLPFVLYDYQKDAIRALFDHIDNGKDLLFEKSRDMGASWIIFCYVPLWYFLFRDGSNFLIGSYKEELVDNRSKDSLFGLIDFAMDNLPKWLLPKGFNKEKHRNHRKLLNPMNFNQITGDTMNPDFGRGSRKTAILFDELGFWEYAKEAWDSAAQATACRIANSTPQGYNFFAMLRNQEIGHVDIHTMHWRQHPLKDELWYEFEKARSTPETIAQELDISYSKSQEGRVYPEWDEDRVQRGMFEYDDDLDLYVGWDYGREDPTAIIWAQKTRDGRLRIVDVYKNSNKHIEFFIPLVTGFISSELAQKYNYNADEMRMIEKHRDWKPGTHFGDPSGRFMHQASDFSIFDILKQHGIYTNFRDDWKGFQKRKGAAKLLIMDGIELNDMGPRTTYFNMCMAQAAYPRIRKDGQFETKSVLPVHNWTSHYRSAFEYLALGIGEGSNKRQKPFDKIKVKPRFNKLRTVGY